VTERRDWSEKDLRKMIVDQRRFMWRADTIERIAISIGLGHGMTVTDVGCGLGYLGWTFREFYGETGTYIGLDCSENLLNDALALSKEWSKDVLTEFIRASAYHVPLPDGYSDVTMCQTLLMHLEHPQDALEEMVRITRPGGAIMCMEPDNLSWMLSYPYSSQPDMSLEARLYWHRISMIGTEGRKRLGRGDSGIGSKVPHMMSIAGLVRIDARANDMARFIQPPYETEAQEYWVGKIRERIDEETDEKNEKRAWKEYRECFLAGGGSRSAFYRMKRLVEAKREQDSALTLDQIESGTLFRGQGPSAFFCFTGFVPG